MFSLETDTNHGVNWTIVGHIEELNLTHTVSEQDRFKKALNRLKLQKELKIINKDTSSTDKDTTSIDKNSQYKCRQG